jgi:hypothetical protein
MTPLTAATPFTVARQVTIGLALAATLALVPAAAQRNLDRPAGTLRRTATVAGLIHYPIFFHTQTVRVRGELSGIEGSLPWLLSDENQQVKVVPGTNAKIALAAGGKPEEMDITGVFLDVGRLEQGHPRATQALLDLSQRLLNKPFPGPGELIVLVADTAVAAEPLAAPSVRTVALDPERYIGQEVSVIGRFRGRNLYGDLPDAPGISRWDFVLQSADAAIWVTGKRPRLEGIGELNPERRADTGRWLQVRGTVRTDRGLIRIEAVDLRVSQPPPPGNETEVLVQVPEKGPPPEVVFSAPTQDETDVSPGAPIRIQFSRDLDPTTLKDQVRLGYVGPVPDGADPSTPPPSVTVKYDEGRRVMEVTFSGPLDRFRRVQVQLLPGIMGKDGQPLVPWKMTYTVGR